MIISHSRQFILLAPWKTASSTCHRTLEDYNESPYSRFFHWNPTLARVVHQHLTLADLLALPEGKLNYRRIAFVRNPYDRAYSGFLQLKRDADNHPTFDYSPPWVGNLVRAQVAENLSRLVAAGYQFDRWIELLPDYEIFEPGRNTNMVLHPAHYWTHIAGEIGVDFVGKVEDFDTDFKRFCEHVGIPTPPIETANVSDVADDLDGSYSKYSKRMSRRSLDRINELFSADFEYFGYEKL